MKLLMFVLLARVRGGRHGVDVAYAVLLVSSACAHRVNLRSRGSGGRISPRRAVGPVPQPSHGE